MLGVFFFNPTSGAKSLSLMVYKISRRAAFIADIAGSESMESRHNLNLTLEASVYQFDPKGVKYSNQT